MFINKDVLFNIKFYVRVIRGYKVHIVDEEGYAEILPDQKDKYEEVCITLKPLSWGSNCAIRRAAQKINPETQMKEWDGETYADCKVKRIIYKWSFTRRNENGDDIPVDVTSTEIDNLHPDIIEHILRRYDKEMEVTPQDLKNS
jgi:hypothetical protein